MCKIIDIRILIYKKHLNELKTENKKSSEWNKAFYEICEKVFSENTEEILKYKIMLSLERFEYIGKSDGHQFSTNKEYMKKYINYYNEIVSELKNVKIRFMFAWGKDMREKIKKLLHKYAKIQNDRSVQNYVNSQNFESVIDDLIELFCNDLTEYLKENNPYPESIFKEPSKEHLNLAIKLFNENGISVDGYNGSMGRFARNGMIRQIVEFKSMFED